MADYGRHEVLDRLMILVDQLEENIIEHEWTYMRPFIREKLIQAVETLNNIHQAISNEHMN